MHIDYVYYLVRKGSKTAKMIDSFYDKRVEQLTARKEFAKNLGFEEYVISGTGIVGFKMEHEEATERNWIPADHSCPGYYKPRARGKDSDIRKQMNDLPAIGARDFTCLDEYMGVGCYIMVGLAICSITPHVLNGKYVLSVPLDCIGEDFKPEDHFVRELKMSEFRKLQAAQEKIDEKETANT